MDTLNVININGKDYNMSSPTSDEFKKLYIESFGDEYIREEKNLPNFSVNSHSVDGYFFELTSNITNPFKVQIFDEKENLVYDTELSSGMYTKLNRKYYTKWKTRLFLEDLVFEHQFDLENSRVFIVFESSSLGDTIAWMPYCEEFRKKHNCDVIVSTFRNDMFKNLYPNIEFVERGSVVNNIKALYRLGWFYDKDKEPVTPNLIPLQKSASNILGLDFEEIKPNIKYNISERPISEKYITIASQSTAGLKYWNHPTGWQEVVNHLTNLGYKVVHVSKEGTELKNVIQLSDTSMETTINYIHHSEFFIGLSSGLSWLSWAIGKHVVMISNFTSPDHEFVSNCTRIINHDVCNGCWNNPLFKFDKGDWDWCPEFQNTERHFECHKSITPEMVINKIQHLL